MPTGVSTNVPLPPGVPMTLAQLFGGGGVSANIPMPAGDPLTTQQFNSGTGQNVGGNRVQHMIGKAASYAAADPFNLDGLSDQDLIGMASSLGIDIGSFGFGGAVGGQPNNTGGDPALMSVQPEVAAAVSRVFGAQRDLGNQELERNAIATAGGRGLNMTDTPIADPYLRSKALFESQLRGQEASSLLGLQSSYTNNRNNFLSGIYNFQQQLEQQAIQNRLQLSGQAGNLASNLYSSRLRAPTGSTQTVGGSGLNLGGPGVSAIGTGLSQLTGLFGSVPVSSGFGGLADLFGFGGDSGGGGGGFDFGGVTGFESGFF